MNKESKYSKQIELSLLITCVCGLAYLFIFGIYQAFTLPIVQKSHSTQKCVKVIDETKKFSCDNLPNKYYLEWVK